MKAISIWQPWATLWAFKIKKFETRTWAFPAGYTGPVAVHAAKKRIDVTLMEPEWWEAIESALETAGQPWADLPYGALVGVCNRVSSRPVDPDNLPDPFEQMLGRWTAGCHYWIPENMRIIPDPVAYTGRQGLFNVPDFIVRSGQARPCKPHQIGLF